MKNITVAVEDHVYRKAREAAARMDTSVSALVAGYLRSLDDEAKEAEFQRLLQDEIELRKQVHGFRAADNLSRDELYRRR
ncbi:MAG: hypothetical protein EPN33_15020 [Acidobacteria bacterium]|nr:MAG: hypothetical protein EPN33_15020 [Acidobacteriota bacterium]